MSARKLIRIDFACNDPDNGCFVGRVCQIQLAGTVLELEAVAWSGLSFRGCPRIRFGDRAVIVSGFTWPVVGVREWYGNWCWNAAWMLHVDALRFLAWLQRRRRWRASSGMEDLFDAWGRPAPLDFGALQPGGATLGEMVLEAAFEEQARG